MGLLKRFRKYLEEQKLSEISIKNYLLDVNKFLYWQLAGNQTISFSPSRFQAYYQHLLKSLNCSSTLKRHLSSLRQFGQFLETEKLLYRNPFKDWQLPPVSQPWLSATLKDGEKLLDKFGKSLKKENLAQTTIVNYLSDVRQFLSWMEKR